MTIEDVIVDYPRLTITPTTAADVSMEIELPADHTLTSADTAIVTVDCYRCRMQPAKEPRVSAINIQLPIAEKSGMGNIWTITAIKKGMAEVRICERGPDDLPAAH